ncbi:HK97 gp10 family phage protein [Bacteroides sp. 214]|uniref:HK97 gp10 family phage protein n=1 Tax=Bacteroides sp. 214 TaxID=2302935 RepID=UPI0013CF742A|nr:HK97 gp10 family phage protein [Bacteroides sp. 214]NDW11961.1 HK97 gp10 family phage protein [Bacteroides sp. 214]
MGIKPNFTRQDIQKSFEKLLDEIERKQIRCLQMLGEKCLTEARLNGSYQDQTGNLRSSIGYMVFHNGMAIHSVYDQVKTGSEGVKAGEALAKKIGSENPQGVCLVVTAGMNYALYVEAKGFNVITSAEHLAERELPRMLEKLIGSTSKW